MRVKPSIQSDGYSLREVEQRLGISRTMVRGLIRSGFVTPVRGAKREYRFSFQDLILMRTAQGLSSAQVPTRRIGQSLKRLREQLPQHLPLSGLRISAVGDRVVVSEGAKRWQADSGQYVLDFSLTGSSGGVAELPVKIAVESAHTWFERAVALEEVDARAAQQAYRQAIALDGGYAAAYINLGRLLHGEGQLAQAERAYAEGLQRCRDAVLHFNLGVLLEDLQRGDEAIAQYQHALTLQDDLADAHYNLALLFEAKGQARQALRHLREYQRARR